METAKTINDKRLLFVSDENVGKVFQWGEVITALTNAYSGDLNAAMVPARTMARGDGFWLRSLSAISPSGEYFGSKLIAASPRMRKASYLISLFDQRTMALAALLDGNRITDIRTAAISIVAVNAVKPQGNLRVAVIGSSALARGMMNALLAVREVSSARVFSPTPASREKYADEFRATHGLTIEAVDNPAQAMDGADVVICAARSRDESPVIRGEWLQPGMIVLSVGSTLPEQREVDVDTMQRAAAIIADMPEEVVHETGDSLAAIRDGVDVEAKTISLNDLLAGKHPRQFNDQDIVLYKSVGSALQDVVTAEVFLRKAVATGNYEYMPSGIVTIDR